MRQLCNFAYAVKAERFVEDDAFERFHAELHLPPGERYVPKATVDPGLLRMMGG